MKLNSLLRELQNYALHISLNIISPCYSKNVSVFNKVYKTDALDQNAYENQDHAVLHTIYNSAMEPIRYYASSTSNFKNLNNNALQNNKALLAYFYTIMPTEYLAIYQDRIIETIKACFMNWHLNFSQLNLVSLPLTDQLTSFVIAVAKPNIPFLVNLPIAKNIKPFFDEINRSDQNYKIWFDARKSIILNLPKHFSELDYAMQKQLVNSKGQRISAKTANLIFDLYRRKAHQLAQNFDQKPLKYWGYATKFAELVADYTDKSITNLDEFKQENRLIQAKYPDLKVTNKIEPAFVFCPWSIIFDYKIDDYKLDYSKANCLSNISNSLAILQKMAPDVLNYLTRFI